MAKKVKKTAKKSTSSKTVKKKAARKSVKKAVVKKKVKKSTKKAVRKVSKKKVKKAVRKIVTRKSSTASLPQRKRRKRYKTTLSKTELRHFRELLIGKLKEIIGDVDHIESESLKKSRQDATGDLSSMPIHMADIGSDNYEQEFALGLMDSERKIVHDIYAALKRIDEGAYGICEGTGEPIPKARLEGIPWTRYCVKYAEMVEKGLVNEEDHWYDYDDDEEDEEEVLEGDDDDGDDDREDILFYGYDDDDDEEEL